MEDNELQELLDAKRWQLENQRQQEDEQHQREDEPSEPGLHARSPRFPVVSR